MALPYNFVCLCTVYCWYIAVSKATCSYTLSTTYAPLLFSPLYSLSFSLTILSVIQRSSEGFVLLTGKHLNFCPCIISDISLLRLFLFLDLSIFASSCNVCFGWLSINHAKPALVFSLEALSSLTYVIIHWALLNFLLDNRRDILISVSIFYFVAFDSRILKI